MPSAPFDPNIQSEKIAFDAEELIACASCGRMNPPNRFKCLYCAHGLVVQMSDSSGLRLVSRKLELWERGFNVVVQESTPDADVEKIAGILSKDPAELADILNTGVPLPLARVESETEAAFLHRSFTRSGLKCFVLSDADLDPDRLPVRLRGLEITDASLIVTDFNTSNEIRSDLRDLVLAVTGSITFGRTDSREKRRPGGKAKLLDETATISDEAVLDLYRVDDTLGYRINQAGFDFSCLGQDKGLLAAENMQRLLVRLKQEAPNLTVVDNYDRIRHVLAGVWDVEYRNDSQGLKRSGLGRVEFGRIASTSNLNQFTKYSRLQRHLYEAQK